MNDVKKPTAVRLEDYTPPAYRTSAVELLFRLDPQATRVIAKLSVERAGDTEAGTPLRLSGDGPQLLGPPLQRAGAPAVEHTAHLGEDTGCTTVGGLVTRDLDCHENSSKLLDPIP